jgi:diguanylate cyclase (GGDEF)-like protein/PAS domain S-box-containing protein
VADAKDEQSVAIFGGRPTMLRSLRFALRSQGRDTPAQGQSLSSLAAFLDELVGFDGIMLVRSIDSGRFLIVNPAFEKFLGRPAAEIIGRTVSEVYPPEDAETILARDQAVLSGDVGPQFLTLHDSTGALRRFVAHKFPLFDQNGKRFALGSMAMDITDIWHEAETSRAARFETETRFRAVFDHAPIGQIFSEIGGAITLVNDPMAAMLGYTPSEMIGRPVSDFASAAELARIKVATEKLLADETMTTNAVRRFRHKAGHLVPVRVTSALLRDRDGAPRWWVSLVVDITNEEHARVELEQAHKAALLSADRLRLLHSIATAANEATTLDALAPRVLATVCSHFRWAGGAVLRWDGEGEPSVVCAHGRTTPALTVARPGSDDIVLVDERTVLVPLPCPEPMALLFVSTDDAPDENQREVLSLVASETARVIERESAARRLRESEQRFRSVFDSSPLAMALTFGNSGTFGAVNTALCQLFGRSADELGRMRARDVCHPDDAHLPDAAGAAAMAAPDGRHRFEMRFLHSSGAVLTTVVSLAYMQSRDGTSQLLAQIEDITARRTVEEVLRRQAEHDALTGLANRTQLGRILCEMAGTGTPCAILFIDLDGFKLINDTRGHDVGDEVLLEVAARLRAAVRPSDVVARFGGDEFVVVCAGRSPGDELSMAQRVSERIEHLLRCPIKTQDGPATVTASVGIAGGLIDPDAPQELLQRADAAMYQAKRLGKDRREIYDDDLHARALEHQRTEASLRTALADNRFVVHYQPIVDLADSTIVGFEALVRLVDEQGRLVAPDKFITVAEQSGLIVPLGAWVLRESCRAIAWLRGQTGRPYTVSVNLAARQAARTDLAATVRGALEASGLPQSALTLELTESALLEADEATIAQLVSLRDSGVVIGLDDFGTGYSSLTYLRRFPVSHLKVDRSFVSGMEFEPDDQAIVRAVTSLASELGLSWIAEGVETPAQRDLLAELGPGLAQGYLFSPPVPECDLLQLVSPFGRTA